MKDLKRIEIIDLLQGMADDQIEKEICVKGWVRSKRGNKNIAFIALNDGTIVHNIQVVVELAQFDQDMIKRITTGASLRINGKLVEARSKC